MEVKNTRPITIKISDKTILQYPDFFFNSPLDRIKHLISKKQATDCRHFTQDTPKANKHLRYLTSLAPGK